jgi:hypothetical protein
MIDDFEIIFSQRVNIRLGKIMTKMTRERVFDSFKG